jgi:hypothetical protein
MNQETTTPKVYVRNVKSKMFKYEVINWDAETKDVTLRTDKGIIFSFPGFTKEKATKLGYELVKE